MATIEPSGFVRSLIRLQCVPKAPTAQTGEKFGAMAAAFKMRSRSAAKY